MLRERELHPAPGIFMLLLLIAATAGGLFLLITGGKERTPMWVGVGALLIVVSLIGMAGLFTVQPNEAKVLTLFGNYKGTVKTSGLWFTNPFNTKRGVSLRIRNFETAKLKVNDARSNPVEIGAIVVWKVIDTAEAVFEVNDYEKYVTMQSESALRALASSYPYDHHGTSDIALSTHTIEVSKGLMEALHERFAKAGVEVLDARISPPGVCAGNCRGDAATAAGGCGGRCPANDCGRCGWHGRTGVGAVEPPQHRHAG